MRLLVLGGTAFLGREVARAALGRGHEVTCLARGTSGPPPDGVRWVQADRDDEEAGLAGVEHEDWDAVVDVARQPGQVRRSCRLLAPRASHYVFVSTGNVYADHESVGTDESAALLPPLAAEVMADLSDYGSAKVACEGHVLAAFGAERCLVARAGLIGGPGDVSGRSGYWPWRIAHPSNVAGEVLVPDRLDFPAQVLDVRDLADWLVRTAEQRTGAVVDAVGETVSFGDLLAVAQDVASAGAPRVLVPAPVRWLDEVGVQEWMGPRSLPMWIADPDFAGFTSRPGLLGRQLGLTCRPLVETLRDVLAWEEHRGPDEPRGAGLTDDEERELLATVPRDDGAGPVPPTLSA